METCQTDRAPRELRCPECGHWMHHRPGDVYGCSCGNFTFLCNTEAEAEQRAAYLWTAYPDREVVIGHE